LPRWYVNLTTGHRTQTREQQTRVQQIKARHLRCRTGSLVDRLILGWMGLQNTETKKKKNCRAALVANGDLLDVYADQLVGGKKNQCAGCSIQCNDRRGDMRHRSVCHPQRFLATVTHKHTQYEIQWYKKCTSSGSEYIKRPKAGDTWTRPETCPKTSYLTGTNKNCPEPTELLWYVMAPRVVPP